MDHLIQFVSEQLYILIAGLYIIGLFLKNIPNVKDWTIPWILTCIGVIFSISINGLSGTSILQGIICAGLSVYSNQLIKQTKRKQ